MRLRLAVVFFALLFTTIALAEQVLPVGYQMNEAEVQEDVLYSSQSQLSMRVQTGNMISETLLNEKGEFVSLKWINSGVEGRVGQPEVPVKRYFVEIPWDAEIEISNLSESSNIFTFENLNLTGFIKPIQPPREKNSISVVDFQFNTESYTNNSFLNLPVVEVEEYFIIRGKRIASVIVRPFDYNPVSGEIKIINDLEFTLTFTNGDLDATQQKAQRYSSVHFNEYLDKMIINSNAFGLDDLPVRPGYLIISVNNDSYLTALEPFVEWKSSKGWDVTLVTTETAGTSNYNIRSYIQEAYEEWEIPPTFVLLVGDTPAIPHFNGSGTGSPDTDLNYSAVDGTDYIPDLGISRFTCTNLADLENQIFKSMQYEQVTWENGNDWVMHTSFIAGEDNYDITETTHDDMIETYFTPHGFTSDQIYMVSFGATTPDIATAINGGRSFVCFSGHGSNNGWADGPPFNNNDVAQLTNTVHPFIQSYACVTGSYADNECFSEAWVRDDHGAFAFMGSSVNSYWDEDDLMERAVFEAWFNNQTPGDEYNLTWVNGMTNYGKLALYEEWGNTGTVRRYYEMYNIMGDGTVNLWSSVPVVAEVECTDPVLIGTDQMTITVPNVPSWAVVYVESTVEEDVVGYSYLNSEGVAEITLSQAPVLPGAMNVTITGPNLRPHQQEVQIIAAEGPYLLLDSLAINDENGWLPNGVLDYCETGTISLWLNNVGVATANAPLVTLTCEDTLLNFTDAEETGAPIDPENIGAFIDVFTVVVDPLVEDQHVFLVEVNIVEGEYTFDYEFEIRVNAPDIVVDHFDFVEITGNRNNYPDPGETVTASLILKNEGHSPLPSSTVNMASNDPLVTLEDVNCDCPQIDVDGTASTTYTLSSSFITPYGYAAVMNIDYTSDNNRIKQIQKTLIIGDVHYLPTGPDVHGYAAYDMLDGEHAEPYDWWEISADSGGFGQEIEFLEDNQVETEEIPIRFTYYGQDFDVISITTEGYITMSGFLQSVDYSNSGIPNADGPWAMIAPYWEDLDPTTENSGGVWFYHDEQNERFIIEYCHVEQFNPRGTFETFQVILYDSEFHPQPSGDSKIVFMYKDMSLDVAGQGTIGIENSTEQDGIQYYFDGRYNPYASTITDEFTITFISGIYAPLDRPTNLLADLNTENGVVNLTWAFEATNQMGDTSDDRPSNYEGKPLNLVEPTFGKEGSGLDDLDDLDEFVEYRIYRGSSTDEELVNLGSTTEETFIDTLLMNGEYQYCVTAFYNEGESSASNVARVSYTTSSNSLQNDGLPKEYEITSVYPNPFNPTVNVVIAVPKVSNIKAEIFNRLGRRVAVLANQPMQPGYRNLQWTAEGASGIYFLRVQGGDGWTDVRKVIFLK